MNRFFQPAITAVLLSAALVVIAVTLLGGSVARAASYQKTDATIVDPIMDNGGNTHLYSGNDLEPIAFLYNANLGFADLTDADLTGANLDFANLTNADLFAASLYNADLNNANLSGANLHFANLHFANLHFANLYFANLGNANLDNADLSYAYLYNADLYFANLTNADLYSANLTNADLSNATFSTGTTLPDGQTVLQHGFDTAGLQAYLEGYPHNAGSANIILVPEPHTLLLASLASIGLMLRRRGLAR
jgi:uncharacterized protein YjbI with pentapeptide repeats